MRLTVADVECVKPIGKMPNLRTSAKAQILADGAHHSVLSYALNAQHMCDYAEMAGIGPVHIGKDIDMNNFKTGSCAFGHVVANETEVA